MNPVNPIAWFDEGIGRQERADRIEFDLERIGWTVGVTPKWLRWLGVSMAFTPLRRIWLKPEVYDDPVARPLVLTHEGTHAFRQEKFPGGRFAWLAMYLGLYVVQPLALLWWPPFGLAWQVWLLTAVLFVTCGGWFRMHEEVVAVAADRMMAGVIRSPVSALSERSRRLSWLNPPYFTFVPQNMVEAAIEAEESRLDLLIRFRRPAPGELRE